MHYYYIDMINTYSLLKKCPETTEPFRSQIDPFDIL